MNYPTYEIEKEVLSLGYKYVVGTDEAGRGGLAGPVVAAAVYIPADIVHLLEGKVNDSKKLSKSKRKILAGIINERCHVGVQAIGADVIDEINILEATKLAMRSAIEQLEYYDYILVDGTVDLSKHIKTCPHQKIIRGDAKSISIAAASIIAKVTRDNVMTEMHREFPIYGFDKHMGYGTKDHRGIIREFGPCFQHRKTFKCVKEYL